MPGTFVSWRAFCFVRKVTGFLYRSFRGLNVCLQGLFDCLQDLVDCLQGLFDGLFPLKNDPIQFSDWTNHQGYSRSGLQ
jgi:hypothetical protein